MEPRNGVPTHTTADFALAPTDPDELDAIAEPRTALTVQRETIRAFAGGIIESASTTFLVLCAVRYFHAPNAAKGLLAATANIGFLLSPLAVVVAQRFRLSASAMCAVCFAAASLLFSPAIFTGSVWMYTISCTLAMSLANCTVALITKIYQENYPRPVRGRLLSRTIVLRILTVAIFSLVGGQIADLPRFGTGILIALFSAAAAVSSWCMFHCPSEPIREARSPLSAAVIREVWEDRLFRNTMSCWMCMGFGNLMMVALRVEYLANPAYGLTLSTTAVALFTGVLPNLARFTFSRFWGRLFDRVNFFALRIVLNFCFSLSILAFFSTGSTAGLVIGALIFGASNAGGDIAWTLWVTKFAPAEKVAAYMSLHVFLTGIRGILAPMAAFHLLAYCSVTSVAWIAAGLIVIANIFMIPELRHSLRREKPHPVLAPAG